MEVKVAHRYAGISPRKARLVVDLIRGATVDDAFSMLQLARKRASSLVAKLLRSAVAAAAERSAVEADELFVKKAWVDPGPTLKGWWARPRGTAARLRHRSSHITLVVATRVEKSEEG